MTDARDGRWPQEEQGMIGRERKFSWRTCIGYIAFGHGVAWVITATVMNEGRGARLFAAVVLGIGASILAEGHRR